MPNLPATIPDDDELVGLEDFDTSRDLVMPILKVDNETGELVDNLSKERTSKLECVVMGYVKGRVLWPAEMGEDIKPPLCRSYDFALGFPSDDFPEKASGLTLVQDQPPLCEQCSLKEWGSHPKNETAWCTEQWHFVLLTEAGGGWAPIQFTVQRSGLKDARAYMSGFRRRNTPPFFNTTVISLDARKRGTVKYAVPQYRLGPPTPIDLHEEWKDEYRRIREWLRTPRAQKTDDDELTTTTSSKSPNAVPDDEEVGF